MRGQLITVHTDGSITRKDVEASPTLEELQEIVGGFVEVVPYFDRVRIGVFQVPCTAFCNETGKLDGLPVNEKATEMWRQVSDMALRDELVGNVVIVTGDDELLESL